MQPSHGKVPVLLLPVLTLRGLSNTATRQRFHQHRCTCGPIAASVRCAVGHAPTCRHDCLMHFCYRYLDTACSSADSRYQEALSKVAEPVWCSCYHKEECTASTRRVDVLTGAGESLRGGALGGDKGALPCQHVQCNSQRYTYVCSGRGGGGGGGGGTRGGMRPLHTCTAMPTCVLCRKMFRSRQVASQEVLLLLGVRRVLTVWYRGTTRWMKAASSLDWPSLVTRIWCNASAHSTSPCIQMHTSGSSYGPGGGGGGGGERGGGDGCPSVEMHEISGA